MNEQVTNKILTILKKFQEKTGTVTRFKPEANKRQIDGTLGIIAKNKEHNMFVEYKRELRAHHLPALMEQTKNYNPLLVIAETIFPKLKVELRTQKIGYLDAAGNAYINIDDLVILVDGQKKEERERPIINRAFTKAGLKVVFHLLLEDEFINLPYRELAKMAGVGLGNINYVIGGLMEMKYVVQLDAKRKKLHNKKDLLDRWMQGFDETLKQALHVGNFKFTNPKEIEHWRNIHFDNEETVWGGEPAADILTNNLNPAELTIYTKKNKADIMKKFRLVPAVDGNVRVYEKFWNTDLHWQSFTAPPLLVYADLIFTGDPRCQEIGKQIFDQYLKNDFR